VVDGFRLRYYTLKTSCLAKFNVPKPYVETASNHVRKDMLPLLQFHLRWFYWFSFISKFSSFGFCQQVVLFIFSHFLFSTFLYRYGFDPYNKTLIGVFDLSREN
jgi:hypothetical protein